MRRSSFRGKIPQALLATLMLATAAAADDWPQFRGPTGQGTTTATGLPGGNPDGLEAQWKTPLPGQGCSSPIVSDGRVYVTTAYEGEEPHPWDRIAFLAIVILASCVSGMTLFMCVNILRSLFSARAKSLLLVLLSAYTVLAIAATTLILVKPRWIWQFPDVWSGTVPAPAELEFVERFYLRPALVLFIGMTVMIFAHFIAPVHHLIMSRWLAFVTACTSLSAALAAGLIGWQPDWFFEKGQPCLAWIVTGGVALFGLAGGVGWLAESSKLRLLLSLAGLGLVWWMFLETPHDEFSSPLELRIKVAYLAPACMLFLCHAITYFLSRRRLESTNPANGRGPSICRGLLPILLPALGLVLFVRSNYLLPEAGVVRAVLCLDAQSGAVLWQTPVYVGAAEKRHAFNSHATPTPACDKDGIYVYFGSGLAGLDKSGHVRWLHRDPDFHRFSRYGTGSSLALAGDVLIVFKDSEFQGHGDHLDDNQQEQQGRRASTLTAYDRRSGAERWTVSPDFSHDSYMTPLVWKRDGELEVVIATWKTLAGFAVKDGSLLWKHPYPMQQIVPSLAVHEDCLFVTGGNAPPGPMQALRPPAAGKPAEALWYRKNAGGSIVSPVCWDGHVFAVSPVGVVSCRTAETGALRWDRSMFNRFLGSLSAGDGKLFAVDEEGTLYILDVKTGATLAEHALDERCAATPALADGSVFVRTKNYLWRLSDKR